MLTPELASDEVHVWRVHLPAWAELFRGGPCRELLSPDELERAARFRTTLLRTRYEVTRALLRHLLARYTGVPAQAIAFSYAEHGKPLLAGETAHHLKFNLSHSGDEALFAFTRAGEVGVDIERARGEMPRMPEIASKYFAPEEWQQIQELNPEGQVLAFFRCWTRKEAILKARGDGIFGGLQSFAVTVGPEARLISVQNGSGDVSQWSLHDLGGIEGGGGNDYCGAVAVQAPGIRLHFAALRPDCGLVKS